ncbi:MAG TPA: pitrilysin family protein [Gemmatimonadales bacterium]|nr:pitrilysin family protein [Gemmatimonadales bacterium]
MTPLHYRLALALVLLPGALAAQGPMPTVTAPPRPGAPPALQLPAIERGSLANGLQLQVVEMHEVPLVQAVLLIEGGARLDADRPGLATFTANLLDEGAGDRDAFQLAAELEYLGASLSTSADWNRTRVALRAPKRTFAQAMQLVGDVVLRPRFSALDVQRQRDLRIAGILSRRDQPEAVSEVVFSAAVFPAAHPYHRPIDGDSAAAAGLDSAAVRNFWERTFVPARGLLLVTGDVTLTEAREVANAALGGWTTPRVAAAPMVDQVPAPARPATRVVLVDKPGAAQSVIAIGAPGYDRHSPDYPALTLLNTILGGSFSARLNDILREQKGYTYGAFSAFDWQPIPSAFVAGASVRTDVTDSSLAIFVQEFRRIRTEPVSAAELDRARQYVVLGALGDFETTGQVAGQIAALLPFRLPLETIPRDLEAIGRLGAADVQRAAGRYLDPDRMTIVVVGDLKVIRPGIEALKLGPIELRDVEGRLVSE